MVLGSGALVMQQMMKRKEKKGERRIICTKSSVKYPSTASLAGAKIWINISAVVEWVYFDVPPRSPVGVGYWHPNQSLGHKMLGAGKV